jgi:tRNA pseudouridine13 synthase
MPKIKVRPEDFVVEELIDIPFSVNGTYTVLKLEKKYWNTLDVIDFVARRTKVSKNLFARAGLKDRYAQSTQYLTFKGNFRKIIKEDNFTLKPIGRSNSAVKPGMLRGNNFFITLRNMTEGETEKLQQNGREVTEHGFPNYFDEQRFGSARHGQGFIAKKMVLEHYQGALKLLMCFAYKEDSKQERTFKKYCLSHWRDWLGCLKLAPPFYRPILRYLSTHPKDYRNAIKKIDREFLNLYLLAYQSYLFNETLARLVKQHADENVKLKYSMGEFVFFHKLDAPHTLAGTKIPMVNEKTRPLGTVGKNIAKVLAKEGITLKQMALQKMRLRGVRFKYFLREAIVSPAAFAVSTPVPDEIYTGKSKCKIECTLPPGTYATILIKRLLL